MLPDDLKNFRADDSDDLFQIMPPDIALFLLIVGGFVGYVFRGYL
jgi:hypothetical protein